MRSVSAIWDYEKQILAAFPSFFDSYLKSEKAPPLFSHAVTLMRKDLLPALIAHFLSVCVQKMFDLEETSSLMRIIGIGLFLFSWLCEIQFWIHKNVLLLTLSAQFSQMEDKQTIHNTICKQNCNSLRIIKGEVRDIALITSQDMILKFIRSMPPMLAWIAIPLQLLFHGQLILGYPLANAKTPMCERHRRENLRQHPELFFAFGLLHQASVFAVSFLLSAILSLSCEGIPIVRNLGLLPRSVYELYFDGILMMYSVGLAYYVTFPPVVEKATRYCPEFFSYAIANNLIDFSIFKLKRYLQIHGVNTLHHMQEKKVFWQEQVIKITACQIPLEKLAISLNMQKIIQVSAPYFFKLLPSLFREKEAIYRDSIVRLLLPTVLKTVYDYLRVLLQYRQTSSALIQWIRRIDSLFSNFFVSTLLGVLGVSAITDMLTLDFITRRAPAFVVKTKKIILKIENWKIVPSVIQRQMHKVEKLLALYEKKLLLLQQIIHSLPNTSWDQFALFLKNSESETFLKDHAQLIFNMLKKSDPQLAAHCQQCDLRFEEEYIVLEPKSEDNCDFPELSQTLCLLSQRKLRVETELDWEIIIAAKNQGEILTREDHDCVVLEHATSDSEDFENIPDSNSCAFREHYGEALPSRFLR